MIWKKQIQISKHQIKLSKHCMIHSKIRRAKTELHRIRPSPRPKGLGPNIPVRSDDRECRPNTQRREQCADTMNQGTAFKRRVLSGTTSNARVMNDKEWQYTSRALNTSALPTQPTEMLQSQNFATDVCWVSSDKPPNTQGNTLYNDLTPKANVQEINEAKCPSQSDKTTLAITKESTCDLKKLENMWNGHNKEPKNLQTNQMLCPSNVWESARDSCPSKDYSIPSIFPHIPRKAAKNKWISESQCQENTSEIKESSELKQHSKQQIMNMRAQNTKAESHALKNILHRPAIVPVVKAFLLPPYACGFQSEQEAHATTTTSRNATPANATNQSAKQKCSPTQ